MKGVIIGLEATGATTVTTLTQEKPDHIAFLITEETSKLPEKILEELKYKYIDYKTFYIKNKEDTIEITEEFFSAFYWLLEKEDLLEIAVDATGSVTPILASMYTSATLVNLFKEAMEKEVKLRLLYTVGENSHSSKQVIELDDPLEAISFVVGMQGIKQFSRHYYTSANETFTLLQKTLLGERAVLYEALAKLSLAMKEWDCFNITSALEHMKESIRLLERTRSYSFVAQLLITLSNVQKNLKEIESGSKLHIAIALYENANRRMKDEKYDDAIARYYSSLEAIIQYCLAKQGIDTAKPDYSKLPKEVVERFHNYCKKSTDGGVYSENLPLELPLKKALILLSFIGGPISQGLQKINQGKLIGLIGMRNQSILAHGIKPISQKDAERFRDKLVNYIFNAVAEAENLKLEDLISKHTHFRLPITIKELVKKGRR